jgi:hypothetical protein
MAAKPAADSTQRKSPSRSRRALEVWGGVTGEDWLERATLVEAGASVDPVLDSENVHNSHDRQRDSDGDESDHESMIGHCASKL